MVLVKEWSFFQLFFLGNIGHKNVFYDILECKNVFPAIKTTSSESRKNVIFPKGLTDGFGPKMAIFPTFFVRQCSTGNCVLRYSRTKTLLFRL